ncbi:FMN-binding protein [Sphaerisporangium sp. NPDC005289]|uniref:FMN-binding protein n=1 Tax=Sphaerisporangium sp. NPDC005289 TaxID=3155247 RepID=UPI00339FF4DB
MRRAMFAVLVTAVGLVLLLSFKPHAITAAADRPAASSQAGAGQGAGDLSAAGGTDGAVTGGDDDEGDESDEVAPPAARSTPRPNGRSGTGGNASSGGNGRVVAGDAADTRWGPVQVEVTLSGRKVTAIRVLRSPDGNRRDIVINERALPILEQEALAAQSAQIDTVSGATYTSEGYARSLQSALDKAGL